MSDEKTDIEAVEIDVPAGNDSEKKETREIIIPRGYNPAGNNKETPDNGVLFSYKPETGLINSVTVCRWKTAYSYYEEFMSAAMKLREYTADACPCVPFFSYIPQYSQLTQQQMRFYLYLRSEIEEERYPEAEYSYILLLIYEIINLSEVNGVEYSLEMLTNILIGYKDSHDRLLLQLSDWLCDFCLINRCVPPREKIEPILPELIRAAEFPEFYICLYGNNMSAESVIRYSASYDYSKSRYAQGNNKKLYDRVMNGVIEYVMSSDSVADQFKRAVSVNFKMTRDSYVGALCTPKIKRRIIIEFQSLSRSHELRLLVSDILKYTENRLRALGGYKSKLAVGKLPDDVKNAADEYLSKTLGTTVGRVREDVPKYEKLYEPAKSELTAEAAKRIEEESWLTTEKLTEAFGQDETGDISEVPEKPADLEEAEPVSAVPPQEEFPESTEKTVPLQPDSEKSPEPDGDSLGPALEPYETEFMLAAIDEDYARERRIAKENAKSPELIADAINTKAADVIGDIVLEETDGGYAVIIEYLEDMKKEFTE